MPRQGDKEIFRARSVPEERKGERHSGTDVPVPVSVDRGAFGTCPSEHEIKDFLIARVHVGVTKGVRGLYDVCILKESKRHKYGMVRTGFRSGGRGPPSRTKVMCRTGKGKFRRCVGRSSSAKRFVGGLSY